MSFINFVSISLFRWKVIADPAAVNCLIVPKALKAQQQRQQRPTEHQQRKLYQKLHRVHQNIHTMTKPNKVISE